MTCAVLSTVSRARSATVGVAASTAASPSAAHNGWNLQQQVLLHVLQVLLLQVSAVFIKEAEIEHLCLALAASRASVAARDAQIKLLTLQMRRMSRRCARIGRAKKLGIVGRRVSFNI